MMREANIARTASNVLVGRAAGGQGLIPTDHRAAAGMAHVLLQLQSLRGSALGLTRIHDAGWNMLLDLYVNDQRDQRVYISALCTASGAPPSSALRQINALEARGIVRIEADDADRRRRWVLLTASTRARLDNYLARAIRLIDDRAR